MAGLNVEANKEVCQLTESSGKDEEEKKSEDTQASTQIEDVEKVKKDDPSSRMGA